MAIDLTELTNIEGVTEAYIFKRSGELMIPRLPYEDTRIDLIGKDIALCSALLDKIGHNPDFFEFIYNDRHAIVKLSKSFFSFIICENATDTTLIRLTLNVIHEEVKVDNDLQKSLRKSVNSANLIAEAQKESELQDFFKRIKIGA